jgi:hypothetical protein
MVGDEGRTPTGDVSGRVITTWITGKLGSDRRP